MYKRKIDMADEIYVINVGGYIGESTKSEIEYAKKHGKKVIAFSGCVTEDAVECNHHGIDAYFPILRSIVSLEEAMNPQNARKNMVQTVEQVFRLIKIYGQYMI